MGAFEHGCSALEHANLCVVAEVIACHALAKKGSPKKMPRPLCFNPGSRHTLKPTRQSPMKDA